MEMGRAEIEAATNHAEKADQEEAQAERDIWKLILGYIEFAVVKCAIELGIADAIESHGSPMPLSELSSALGCVPSSLYRVMRFLTYRGIFQEKLLPSQQDSNIIGYAQTPLSWRLVRHGEKSMAALVLLESNQVTLAAWHALSERVLDNKTSAFEVANNGEELWKANPIDTDLLNEAMAFSARVTVPKIINGCPEVFQDLTSLVDVGGGTGSALCTVVNAFPGIRGINFDLPHVVSFAPEYHDGVEHIGGDMFSSVPKADAALLMRVLHDWNDEKCIQILKNCREAIPKNKGKVIIIDAVIDEENDKNIFKDMGLMLDMVMMAHTKTGKERTMKEWEYVLGEAGFSRHTVKSTPTTRVIQSVIEAYP